MYFDHQKEDIRSQRKNWLHNSIMNYKIVLNKDLEI